MKKYFLAAVALVMISGTAIADNRLTPNISIQEFTEVSGSSLAAADFFLGFDTSANNFMKSDPTDANILSGTIDGATIGGSTAGAGNFTTLDATGATTLTTAALTNNLSLDDGVTDSPSITLQDATNETFVLLKLDAGFTTATTDATDGLNILVGNLKVGNGTPGNTLDGEDVYIEGGLEVDGATLLDGTLTATSTVSLTGATVLGDGATVHSGFVARQVASTTTTITASQCGDHFISDSADVMTLPEASTVLGCRLKFTCGTADDFDINPNDGTDTISSISTTNGTTAVVTLAPSAGDAIRCTDIGGSITLEAIGADLWAQVAGGNGIWTDVD